MSTYWSGGFSSRRPSVRCPVAVLSTPPVPFVHDKPAGPPSTIRCHMYFLRTFLRPIVSGRSPLCCHTSPSLGDATFHDPRSGCHGNCVSLYEIESINLRCTVSAFTLRSLASSRPCFLLGSGLVSRRRSFVHHGLHMVAMCGGSSH